MIDDTLKQLLAALTQALPSLGNALSGIKMVLKWLFLMEAPPTSSPQAPLASHSSTAWTGDNHGGNVTIIQINLPPPAA